jgi:hypothetical protein
LIETMGDWHKVKDALPATLAHNDFNQRNVGFRSGAACDALAPYRPRSANGHPSARSRGASAVFERRLNGGFAHRLLPQIKGLSGKDTASAAGAGRDPHAGAGGHTLPAIRSNIESDIVVLD